MINKNKKSIIVYGLGRVWNKNCQLIDSHYEIVGYSDSNDKLKANYTEFVTVPNINQKDADILVCVAWPQMADIINVLIDEYKISQERIIVWEKEECCLRNLTNRGSEFYSHSQFGEDYVIYSLLREKGIQNEAVRYIELGVWNPIRLSNTYLFYECGAKGILVEANPRYINAIETIRSNDIVLNRAVVSEDRRGESIPFYITEDGGTSSIDAKSIDEHKTSIEEKVEVKTVTINKCMELLGERCTVLSIDLEGLDEEVLFSLDFDRYAPEIICAETRGKGGKLFDYMKEKGYSYVFANGVNDIWSKEI